MVQMIFAFGGNPLDLGGFRDHNPFKLYVQATFKTLLKEHPDAQVYCPLFLGPGQWCADVCIEQKRDFIPGLVPTCETRWLNHQILHYNALVNYAYIGSSNRLPGLDVPWDAEAQYVPPHVFAALSGDVIWFAAVNMEKRTGPAHRLLADLGDRDSIETVAMTTILSPDTLPPAYKVLGALEDLREHIPEKLNERIKKAGVEIMRIIESDSLPEALKSRAADRLCQLLDLSAALTKVETR